MPDFAGVALVDILANGVGMLIIVVVISIAARIEREERQAEKVEELSVVMSRQISTSLVLNTLAASRAARLHDYDNSPIDQVLDPDVMPIIELHRDFVREFYSGATWHRRELLQQPNRMDAWLLSMAEETRRRMRMDIYDIGQYYLVMSILRAHGLAPAHWHFIGGALEYRRAIACPPGVAAKDCELLAMEDHATELPGIEELLGLDEEAGDEGWLSEEDLAEIGQGTGGGGDGGEEDGGGMAGPMPGGTVPSSSMLGGGASVHPGDAQGGGREQAGEPGLPGGMGLEFMPGGGTGRYPSARGDGWGSGQGGEGEGEGQEGPPQIRFRLALEDDPALESLMNLANARPAELIAVLATIMDFLSDLQAELDNGDSPVALLPTFSQRLLAGFENPPELPGDQYDEVEALAFELIFASEALAGEQADPIGVVRVAAGEGARAELRVEPNHLLQEVVVAAPDREGGASSAGTGRIEIDVNAYPAVWQGLRVDLERNSVLMSPPSPGGAAGSGWRAVATITPEMDDFIVGFVHAGVSPDGWLLLNPDNNRVRLDRAPLITPYRAPLVGARGWLTTLFAMLAAAALLLFLARGPVSRLLSR